MNKLKQKTLASRLEGNIYPTAGLAPTIATAATLVVLDSKPSKYRTVRLVFNSQTISVAGADDFGSLKILDLPNSNLYVLGVVVRLTTTQTGFTSNNGTAIDLSIGTAAEAADTTLDSTQADVVAKIDGTGTTAGSVIGISAAPFQVAAGASNAWYLNIADPVTGAGTGVLTISGYIDVTYIDLGS